MMGSVQSAPGHAAADGVAAWRELLTQLDRTTGVAGGWDAAQAFGLLGPRRRNNAFRYLARERQRLLIELRRLGLLELLPVPGMGAAEALASAADGRLPAEFASLAQAYERCAVLAGMQQRLDLARWLAARARIHREHSALLAG